MNKLAWGVSREGCVHQSGNDPGYVPRPHPAGHTENVQTAIWVQAAECAVYLDQNVFQEALWPLEYDRDKEMH